MRKLFSEIKELNWTVAGTALVLITLTGDVLRYGLWISGGAITIHLLATVLSEKDDN